MACSAQAGTFALQAGERPIGIKTFAGYVALAGLVNAAIAAFLLFRLPTSHAPSLRSLLIRAFIYVAGAVLAGMGGARFYWNRSSTPFRFDPPLSFRLFVLVNAAAWVWVPSIALLSRQDSPAAAALSAPGCRSPGQRPAPHHSLRSWPSSSARSRHEFRGKGTLRRDPPDRKSVV